MKMTYTRHYLNTLDEAIKAYAHCQQTMQQLIDKYGDNEVSKIIMYECNRLAELDVKEVEDEACNNPKLWIKRVEEQRAIYILTEAEKSVTGDSVVVMGDKSKKEFGRIKRQIKKCYNDFGRLMLRCDKQQSQKIAKTNFADIIQYPDKEKLLQRLHFLIDGKKGAEVGAVLLKAQQDGLLTRIPRQSEYKSEFDLLGGWSAIHNYMDDNNQNALDKANKIIIL